MRTNSPHMRAYHPRAVNLKRNREGGRVVDASGDGHIQYVSTHIAHTLYILYKAK